MQENTGKFFARSIKAVSAKHWMVVIVAVIAALSAGWLALASNSESPKEKRSDAILPVEILRLQPSSGIETSALYAGTVEARRGAALAFERSGRILRVFVNEGQSVARGEVIAQLDLAELQVQLKQAKSQLAQAEAVNRELHAGPRAEVIAGGRAQVREAEEQLSLARAQEGRREDLLRREAISHEEMDSFRTQVGALAARVDAARQRLRELEAGTRIEQLDGQAAQVALARARIQEVEIQMHKSKLVAPFSGRIARRLLDEGAYASPGTPVVEILESGRPEIRVGLPVNVATDIRPGDVYSVQVGGSRLQASVLRVLPELENRTRVVSVILAIPHETREQVLPGMLAQVEVPRRLEDVGFRVPLSALTRADRGLWACYAIRENEDSGEELRLERREVEILHADDSSAYIRGLIEAGDRIVASGVNRVTDGQRIQVVKES